MHIKSKLRALTSISGLCGIVLLFSMGCESTYIRMPDEGIFPKDTTQTIDSVFFSQDIKPLLLNNCASCHFAGTSLDLESDDMYNSIMNGNFINLSDPESSRFFTEPDPGHADLYLTPVQHSLIVEWIEQGALNN